MRYLVYGGLTGWIGQKVVEFLCNAGHNVIPTSARMGNTELLIEAIKRHRIDRVLILAGLTGRPNVDWCEDHKQETVHTNVAGVLNVVHICSKLGVHVTYLGTGCIYEYDEEHPIGGKTFTEEDKPNFSGSYYSKTKAIVEEFLQNYDNVLTLRIRMPIPGNLIDEERSFVYKILNYAKIVDVPNSMSVLPDLIPVLVDMAEKGLTGVYNFVNPGAVSHNQIMELYKRHVDPEHTWTNFTLEEQAEILKAGRSNCELDASKLLSLYPEIPSAIYSIEWLMCEAGKKNEI